VPNYDYICTACGHRMEVAHGIHGQGPEACPVCGGTMRKAPSAPAVHFKGSGWAKKDRGVASSTKAAAKAAGGDGEATSKKSTGSGDGSNSGSADTPSTSTESKPSTPSTAAGND
jgi:putative FmdB family regulatory protein